jgi:anaphase-promoting complex subunit 3
MLGRLYEQQSDYKSAESEYAEMVRKYPDHPGGHFALASLQERTGNIQAALKGYEAELTINPFDPDALVRAAHLHFQERRVEEASKLAQRALAVNPRLVEAGKLYAQCLLEQDRAGEALPVLDVALQADPNDRNLHFLLARALRKTGDNKRADQEMITFERLTREWNALEKERRGRLENALRKAGNRGDELQR